MRRVLLLGPGALSLGGVVIAFSFLAHHAARTRVDAAAAGFLLIAGGALYTLAGMQRILRDELLLVLRTDGIVIQGAAAPAAATATATATPAGPPAAETLILWDELTAARWDASRGELILERAAGRPVVLSRPFARISGRELAESIAATKRRVAMNLVR
jgi:hypothetical protein